MSYEHDDIHLLRHRPRCLRRGCHQLRNTDTLGLGLCDHHDSAVASRKLGWNPDRLAAFSRDAA